MRAIPLSVRAGGAHRDMHVRETIELGAILACQGPLFIRRAAPVGQETVERYWIASKCRLGRWTHMLHDYRARSCELPSGEGQGPRAALIRPVMEEVLGAEVLLRVWSGLACGWDARHRRTLYEPLVRSVLQGHLEARNQALNLLLRGRGLGMEESVALNRYRRCVERWTDMLLAYVIPEHDVSEFAFDGKRARDFAGDLGSPLRRPAADPRHRLVLASLRLAFASGPGCPSPSGELNRRVASSILCCLDEDLFETSGLPRSLWVERLYATVEETEGMIDQLLRRDIPRHDAPPYKLPGRWWDEAGP